jgi:hypothetical protein
MPQPLTLVLVEKNGDLKSLTVKDYKEEELFKKCGFKKMDGFSKQIDWPIKMDGQKYCISMYGKTDGKANMENKYDFPPPVDNKLFFGCCVLVGQIRDDNNKKIPINLSLDLWHKFYDKLFGGFEDLTTGKNANTNTNNKDKDNDNDDDEDDDDEIAIIPKSKKTKQGGYLKDGFVVDDNDNDNDNDDNDDDESIESDSLGDDDTETNGNDANGDDGIILEDIGSELSEDEYDYN